LTTTCGWELTTLRLGAGQALVPGHRLAPAARAGLWPIVLWPAASRETRW